MQMKKIKKIIVFFRNQLIFRKYDYLGTISKKAIPTNINSSFCVSIASYPKRDPLLTSVFQALSQQTVLPNKWILVLSAEDYPNGLPTHLLKLERKGVEIIWTENNSFAVKKLIPVMQKYPTLAVVTLDDDIIYNKELLGGLLNYSEENPNSIVGYVGKALFKKHNTLHMYYRMKFPADKETPSEQIYLIGWGGIYYPSFSLDEKAFSLEAINHIVPGRGSDIWFWAAGHSKGTQHVCIGNPKSYRIGIPIPLNIMTKPKDLPGEDVMLNRFHMAIDYFGIREKLITTLPDM
jgi:hypothetical protein